MTENRKYQGYPVIMNGDHAEFEMEWAGKDPRERPDWPLPSFDARDWAESFMKHWGHRKEEIDEKRMITWFANSLMRGYDQGYLEGYKQALKLPELTFSRGSNTISGAES